MSSNRRKGRDVDDLSKRQRMQREKSDDNVVSELNDMVEVEQEPADEDAWEAVPGYNDQNANDRLKDQQEMSSEDTFRKVATTSKRKPDSDRHGVSAKRPKSSGIPVLDRLKLQRHRFNEALEDNQNSDDQQMKHNQSGRFSVLPDDLMLKIFLKCDDKVPQQLRSTCRRMDEMFRDHAHLFKWRLKKYYLQIIPCQNGETNELKVSVEAIKKEPCHDRRLDIIYATLSEIKKFAAGAESIHFNFDHDYHPFFCENSLENSELRAHLRDKRFKHLYVCGNQEKDFPARYVLSLFAHVPVIKIENVRISQELARLLLTDQRLEEVLLYMNDYFPLKKYVDEWLEKKRIIRKWEFSFSKEEGLKHDFKDYRFLRPSDSKTLQLTFYKFEKSVFYYLEEID